jgi:uncharacterized protein (TIGR03118 family)
MIDLTRHLAAAALAGVCFIAATAGADAQYQVRTLVTDGPKSDPVLQNPWGVAFSPDGPFWIADNNTGCATLYDGNGTKITKLEVQIPLPGNQQSNPAPCTHIGPHTKVVVAPAAPDGIIWNDTNDFMFQDPNNGNALVTANFIFVTEDGTLSAWSGMLKNTSQAVLIINNLNTKTGPVYKGLATGTAPSGNYLYVTNFRFATVEVYDTNFKKVTLSANQFQDPEIKAPFAPYDIRNINGDLWVTYAKQDASKHDSMPTGGYVDIFDTEGHLLQQFNADPTGVWLNQPWGITVAPYGFGAFSGDILVGNFGNGWTNAFSADGSFAGTLQSNGAPIVIDGLWTLTFGGGADSSPQTLYFTAGPNNETNGRFGTITPVE